MKGGMTYALYCTEELTITSFMLHLEYLPCGLIHLLIERRRFITINFWILVIWTEGRRAVHVAQHYRYGSVRRYRATSRVYSGLRTVQYSTTPYSTPYIEDK